MVKSLFLLILPITLLIFFVFFIIILTLHHEYKTILKSTIINYFKNHSSKISSFSTFKIFGNITILFIFLFYLFFFKILVIHVFNIKLLYINNFIVVQLKIFTWLYLFIIYFFYNQNILSKKASFDLWVFLVSLYLISWVLMCSNNILTVFMGLEIVNVLVMYSFLITLNFNLMLSTSWNYKCLWLSKLCSYQFILNFFSSIIFFFVFNIMLTKTYTTNFLFLYNWDLFSNNSILCFLSLYLAFFIKLGVGPWVFFKIELYECFNWFLLTLYTIVYMSVILVFFLNLFVIYLLPINTLILIFLLSNISLLVFLFSFFMFSNFNFFVFFSFSSLINIMLVIIQLCYLLLIIHGINLFK